MFWERFYSLCEEKGMKPLQVVNQLNMAAGSITKWKNGTIPNGIGLILIADYFEVSIDYLLGRTNDKGKNPLVSDINDSYKYFSLIKEKHGELKLKIFLMKIGYSEAHTEIPIYMTKCIYEGKDISNEKMSELLQNIGKSSSQTNPERIIELENELKRLEEGDKQ